jgi:hypothetical protein
VAKAKIIQDYNRGLFLDLQGHGHNIQRIELGYGLTRNELQLEDSDLNEEAYISESSIRGLAEDNLQAYTHAELLRGSESFGSMLAAEEFPAVPSSEDPFPLNGEDYFSGGYNTLRHGSLDGGAIDGIQMECNQDIRFNTSVRQYFAAQIPPIITDYINTHYNDQFAGNYCNLVTQTEAPRNGDSFYLFPNPAYQQLQISSDLNEMDIVIYNSTGAQVSRAKWTGSPLDVSYLNSGLYFLECQQDRRSLATTAFVKH